MRTSETQIIDSVNGFLEHTVTRVERLRYMEAYEPNIDDGELTLWFNDSVMRFAVEADGERIRFTQEPWTDPFVEPQSEVNSDYVAKHGQWVQVNVSLEVPYRSIVGARLVGILPISNQFAKLIGFSLTFDSEILNVFVDCDELCVTWGANSVPLWKAIH